MMASLVSVYIHMRGRRASDPLHIFTNHPVAFFLKTAYHISKFRKSVMQVRILVVKECCTLK